ncbi:MAG: cytochrome c biogenesis protein [Bacteroidia bacterium]|nr:cytochrome c biogenesis protein [Bacteroidia bacterium]
MIQWWKIAGVLLVFYALIAGLLLPVPQLAILEQSIRNLYYHVPMWFGMLALLFASTVNAIRFLNKGSLVSDIRSEAYANIAMVYGVMGLLTGMIWAKNTWGAYWTNDPKLNSAAIGMLMYLAYMVLRSSMDDEEKRARVSAVYNVFCFPIFVVLIFVLPRLTDSLHPGNGGNPGFNAYDLDSRLRMVFYPAVIGWTLIGFWLADLRIRIQKIERPLS